ncbi:MAG: hypothetical protein RIS94_1788 [Pseudomonadota bacterium]|jgi:two-component sensor histidine kinase
MLDLPRNLTLPVRGPFLRYAVTLALFLTGLGLRAATNGFFPPGFPFLTFFPVVIGTTFLTGRGPGFLCGLLSGLAAWYWFIPPYDQFKIDSQVATALGFFAFVVIVDVLLIDGLMKRQRQLMESEARLAQMADHQSLLFKELQHRVANNLASVASMLRLKRRQIQRDPASALDVIDRADERIELMGRIHRQLYDPLVREMPVADQIRRAVDQARQVASADHVPCDVHVEGVTLDTGRLMTLVLLITETLTNSFKHAFESQPDPQVTVALAPLPNGRYRLVVSDNGCGLPQAEAPVPGLGTAVIRGFVAQLGGTLHVDGTAGVKTVVDFPAV